MDVCDIFEVERLIFLASMCVYRCDSSGDGMTSPAVDITRAEQVWARAGLCQSVHCPAEPGHWSPTSTTFPGPESYHQMSTPALGDVRGSMTISENVITVSFFLLSMNGEICLETFVMYFSSYYYCISSLEILFVPNRKKEIDMSLWVSSFLDRHSYFLLFKEDIINLLNNRSLRPL